MIAYVFTIRGGASLGRSKKQPIVALSTNEVEYIATLVLGSCWHLRSNQQKQYQFFKKLIFMVKILTFRFKYSKTLNFKCWKRHWSCWKSHKPAIFLPMTQPCFWHTSDMKERRIEVIFSLWMVKNKNDRNPNPYEVFIGFLIEFKWLEFIWVWVT